MQPAWGAKMGALVQGRPAPKWTVAGAGRHDVVAGGRIEMIEVAAFKRAVGAAAPDVATVDALLLAHS